MIAGLMIASVVSATGCRKTPKKTTGPELLTTEGPLEPTALVAGARFEDSMTRVTDVTFENVLFDYDSYQIKSSEAGKVDKVAAYMKSNPNVRLVTEGNCDERGTIEYNLALGENRAAAVRAQLLSLGIPAENIQTKSYGEEKPVEAGHSETSWRVNRRTEFALYK
jgi:peptidoglycan-associated lipoprotein